MTNLTAIKDVIEKLSAHFKEKRLSLVTAESCTGGGCAYFIVKHPDCSEILERGFVVYSVNSKEDVLGISNYVLQTYGVVSKEVALEMAKNALEKSKAQISLAITGIDECTVSSEKKHAGGLVWIACDGIDKKSHVEKLEIKGSRAEFCETTILKSLEILLKFVS